MKHRGLIFGLLVLAISLLTVFAVLAYDFPSTNAINEANGLPFVRQTNIEIGKTTLEFVNNTNSLAFFEVRIDGQVRTSGTAHPVIAGDFIYSGVGVDNRAIVNSAPNPAQVSLVTREFSASSTVEVRLALGGERDWDFDWVTFDVYPDAQTKEDCQDGGWAAFGFSNQGQCIRFVNTDGDSR